MSKQRVSADINHKMEEMRELKQKLDKSLAIEAVFPNVFHTHGKVSLRWGGKGYLKVDTHSVSYAEFRKGVSLAVLKGNGEMIYADPEQVMELLSKGIGPKPLVECFKAIKGRADKKSEHLKKVQQRVTELRNRRLTDDR